MKSNDLFVRIAKVCSGNAGVAAVTFLISILLLKSYGQEVFAIFSSFVVFSSIHLSFVNSAFFVPASRIETSDDKSIFVKDCSFYIYLLSVVFTCLFMSFLFFSNVSSDFLLDFSILYFCYTSRGIIRTYSFVVQNYDKALHSDLLFLFSAFFLITPLLAFFNLSVFQFCIAFSILSLLSLYPFGAIYLRNFLFSFTPTSKLLLKYNGKINESKHSIYGVFYSEIVSNSHAYAIPLMFGIINYAPIAAFFMIFRPFAIAASSFLQSERVPLIAMIREEKSINSHLVKLSKFSILLFFVNLFVGVLILFFQKEFLLSRELFLIFTVCAFIIFFRNIKSIISLGLQVKGHFELVSCISKKYVLIIPICILISWLSEYIFSMIFFTALIEFIMLCEFYARYRRSL